MSRRYLEEHASNALFALDIAERETKHLRYTLNTLFCQNVTAVLLFSFFRNPKLWVNLLSQTLNLGVLLQNFGFVAKMLGLYPAKPKIKSTGENPYSRGNKPYSLPNNSPTSPFQACLIIAHYFDVLKRKKLKITIFLSFEGFCSVIFVKIQKHKTNICE